MGFKVSEEFAGRYFNGDNAPTTPEERTIARVSREQMNDGSNKLVAWFMEGEPALVLNKTRATTLKESFGDDTDAWAGKKVKVFRGTTQMQGRMTSCVCVEPMDIPF